MSFLAPCQVKCSRFSFQGPTKKEGSPFVEMDFYADVQEKLFIKIYITENLVSTQGFNLILAASNDRSVCKRGDTIPY